MPTLTEEQSIKSISRNNINLSPTNRVVDVYFWLPNENLSVASFFASNALTDYGLSAPLLNSSSLQDYIFSGIQHLVDLGIIDGYNVVNTTPTPTSGVDLSFGVSSFNVSSDAVTRPGDHDVSDADLEPIILFDDDVQSSTDDRYKRYIVLHELLHAFGLTHPFKKDAEGKLVPKDGTSNDPSDIALGDPDHVGLKYTIMSYDEFDHPDLSITSLPTSLMLLDYLALRENDLLGSYSPTLQDQLNAGMEIANYDSNTADDDNVYRWGKDTEVLHTIYDTAGIDTISAEDHDTKVVIDLREGHFSSYGQREPTENLAIAYGSIIENAIGSTKDDVLIGNVYDNHLQGKEGKDILYGDGVNYDVDDWPYLASDRDNVYGNQVGAGYHESVGLPNESGNDTLEGGAGDDKLFGGAGTDILRGGSENDELHGDEDSDRLEGGEGNDKYYFHYGDGHDTIVDAEGTNTIYLQQAAGLDATDYSTIGALQQVAPGSTVYQEINNGTVINPNTTYALAQRADGTTDLVITIDGGAGGSITIQNFNPSSNTFGLAFSDMELSLPEQEPLSGPHTIGDGIITSGGSPTLIHRADTRSSSIIYDASLYAGNIDGHELYTYQNQEALSFEFGGSNFSDELIGTRHTVHETTEVSDVLYGFGGDDLLRGEAEGATDGDRDILSGGKGNDWLYGGAGNDDLFGLEDRHFSNGSRFTNFYSELILDRSTLENAGDSDYLDGGEGNDNLIAGSGSDILIGGGGNNGLFGFVGNDLLVGGDDVDNIFGDGYGKLYYLSNGTVIYLPYKNFDFSLFSDYNDTIHAGNGNNFVEGDAGDDIITAGNGDDDLFGDQLNLSALHVSSTEGIAFHVDLAPAFHGNDVISGGAGKDDIYGNGGDDRLFGEAGGDIIHGDDFILDEQYHGDDFIDGGDGDDGLIGGGGKDIIQGGAGNDELYGDYSPLPFNGVVYEQIIVGDNDTLYGNEGTIGNYGSDTRENCMIDLHLRFKESNDATPINIAA